MTNSKLMPFVKWAGGKRQLLDKIEERLPQKFNCYYEPFVGGGAVLFDLQPEAAVINDINESLINTYRIIRDEPELYIQAVKQYDEKMPEDGRTYYYELRNRYNEKLTNSIYDIDMAALFTFINKHCFNGLYRVNGKGLYNVPYNNSKAVSIDEDAIREISAYLTKVDIQLGDFEIACAGAQDGDFIFLDSPYAPLNPTSFESYTKEGFDVESHRRLASLFDKLTDKGCYCMLTNHNTEFIHELYGRKGYTIDVVAVKRFINSDAANRKGEEVIIRNY